MNKNKLIRDIANIVTRHLNEQQRIDEFEFNDVYAFYNIYTGQVITSDVPEYDLEFEDGQWVAMNCIVTDYKMVDHGIGDYEFWGAPGRDEQMVPEVTDVNYEIYAFFTVEDSYITKEWNNEDYESLPTIFKRFNFSENVVKKLNDVVLPEFYF